MLRLITALLVSCFVSGTAWATQLEAKKASVKVYSQPDKSSSVVTTLSKGSAVTSQSRKGMYWQVKTSSGQSGYVSVMSVKRKSGSEETGIASAIRDAVKQGRDSEDAANARSRSAVMGVRGLDESSDTAYAGNVKPNLRMVYAMEDLVVTEAQLESIGSQIAREVERKSSR